MVFKQCSIFCFFRRFERLQCIYIFTLTKLNSLILKMEVGRSLKNWRNKRRYVVRKYKTRSSFEKYPQWISVNFYQVFTTLTISIYKLDLSGLHFKKRIFPFSYLASGGECNIVHGSVGLSELISYVSTSHTTIHN